MSKKPILSICIPTYNREKYLKGLLDNIFAQNFPANEVEVLVYDDPSTDNTDVLIGEYMKKYPNIKYVRNIVRVGMTPAFIESVLCCSGEYVWLFGSDDLIGPSGIESLLNAIKNENPDLILNDYGKLEYLDKETCDIRYKMYSSVSDFCNGFHKNIWNSNIPGFDNFIAYFSYISVYCFRLETFKNEYQRLIKEGKKDYLLGHYFNFTYIIFGSINLKKICVYNNPVLTYNQGGKPSWRMNFKILRDMFSVFRMIQSKYFIEKDTKKIFNKILFTWSVWYFNTKIFDFYPIGVLRTRFNPLYVICSKIYTKIYNSLVK